MAVSENLHAGHRQRLKKEFLEHGAEGFSEVRALELLLFYALARQDTNPLAHSLLNRFGSLHGVLTASVAELCTVDGIGENTAILIRLIPELSRLSEYGRSLKNREKIDSSFAAGSLISTCFAVENSEKFVLFCLDSQKRIKRQEEISRGVVNSVGVDVRRVAEIALSYKAAACIAAHNHPDGDSYPSVEDREVTAKLREALSLLGIPLLDHIIVGADGYFSFADAGLL
jgi:DNA repair protein RadC